MAKLSAMPFNIPNHRDETTDPKIARKKYLSYFKATYIKTSCVFLSLKS
jgi:hypothetical protein